MSLVTFITFWSGAHRTDEVRDWLLRRSLLTALRPGQQQALTHKKGQQRIEEQHLGIFVFKGGVCSTFFRFTLKAFISIRVTLGIIQNDYFDHVRHVWDIFGTIRSLKIIFWDYIFENFRLKMNKNTFFGIWWLYKGNYYRLYLFKLRNEEFRCLRSEYMTIIISRAGKPVPLKGHPIIIALERYFQFKSDIFDEI